MTDTAPRKAHITASVLVDTSVERLWEATTDWKRQGDWVLFTRVRGTLHGGQRVGGGVEAWTGVGPLGFLDTMVITAWEPPHRCAVRHTGRVVRGTGLFEVTEAADGRSRLTWSEDLELPFGAAGGLGWRLLRPAVRAALARSLSRLAASFAEA